MTNPDLANTLEELGQRGAQWFYNGRFSSAFVQQGDPMSLAVCNSLTQGAGTLAELIVKTAKEAINPVTGKFGLMEMHDISNYIAVKREAVRST